LGLQVRSAFFAPHRDYYTADWEKRANLTGFHDLVKAFHRAKIEIILDVVFNYPSESDETGPTICLRGIDNPVYSMLDPNDRSRYINYTGTGNTVNCNHPAVRRMILECLRYWVGVMHSCRGLGAGRAVGGFPGERWAEWNGRYRDDLRKFIRGDAGITGTAASRMAGSADLYQHLARAPYQSVNFVTCHDGFTLNDLVSYNQKHNLANGEGGRDGSNADRLPEIAPDQELCGHPAALSGDTHAACGR
jgi:isoamylase